MYRVKKTIVLVGMMGAGKTSVGMALAKLLNVGFLDSDEEIVKAAARPISEIFERDGESFFRDREYEVIGRLLKAEPCVLSTGGGAFLAERNREQITKYGVSVWLQADIDLLWQRVRHRNTRPLLRTANPRDTLRDLYQQREPVYQMADLCVGAEPEYSIEKMAELVAQELLQHRPDVIEKV